MGDPTVSVVVPVHQLTPEVRQCLASLVRTDPAAREIIVVGDGPVAGLAEAAREYSARYVHTRARGGPARARNLGARAATGDVVLFIDSDVVVRPDTIGRVQAAFRQEPDLTALFGSYDDAPAAPGLVSQYRNLLHHYVHQAGREDATTFWTGCGAVRREVFLRLGGFDKRLHRPFMEDIELGYRLRQAGCAIRLVKDLQVNHLKRWTLWAMVRTDLLERAAPWTMLILRHRALVNDLNVHWSGRASVVLSGLGLGALAAGFWRPILWGWSAGFFAALMALNAPWLAFFRRKRGAWFMCRVIPLIILYHLYSGLGFVLGSIRFLFRLAPTPADPRFPLRPLS
jgi:glycosyltransferase involved in cell wall biosynthesis